MNRNRTGPKPTFSKADLIAAVLNQGIGVFTMTSIAKEIGVSHAALYREVPSHNELMRQAMQIPLGEYTPPALQDGDWRQLLTEFAEQIWNVCVRYPTVASGVMRLRAFPWIVSNRLYSMVTELEKAGFTQAQAEFMMQFLTEFCFFSMVQSDVLQGRHAQSPVLELSGVNLETDQPLSPIEAREFLQLDQRLRVLINGFAEEFLATAP